MQGEVCCMKHDELLTAAASITSIGPWLFHDVNFTI